MPTCKDCLHFVPCGGASYEDVRDCPDFTYKSEFVQVVRCKDCKYYQDNNGGYPHEMCKWNENETPDADDYCSFGEKKK